MGVKNAYFQSYIYTIEKLKMEVGHPVDEEE